MTDCCIPALALLSMESEPRPAPSPCLCLVQAPPDAPRPSGEPSLPPLSQIMALFPPASSGSPTRPALEFAPRDVSAIFGEEAQRDPGHLQMNIIKVGTLLGMSTCML
jgi:hypothetical protein